MSTHAIPGALGNRWSTTHVRSAWLVVGAAALTGLCAQIAIPLPGTPVPLTLQTFAVLLTGAVLGPRLGAASMALYVAVGLAGVPWFAGQSSGLHLPTLGYLIGFVVAALLVGRLADHGRDRRFWGAAATMTLGTLVIYACGVPVLAWAVGVSLPEAVVLGVVPFLLGDALKILAASGAMPAAWSWVNRNSAC